MSTGQDFDDFEEFTAYFKDNVAEVLELAIKHEFPNIHGVSALRKDDVIWIQFDKGEYSKEEVESYINKLQKNLA